ncbi:MAG: histidine phosphatase family protein [Nitrospiria bacterium]
MFLRHGATDYPGNKYYCDSKEDPHLNDSGLKQAAYWTDLLSKTSFGAVYVSPSRRTRETANTAAKGIGRNPVIMNGLQERHFGTWGGLTTVEVRKRFPDEWRNSREDLLNFTPPGGESLRDFSNRVNETIQLLLLRHAGQTLLIVTHVGPIRMTVLSALDIPLKNFKRLVVGYCSLTEIEYTESWPNLLSFSRKPE